jgi:hypothetical protein
MSLFGYRSSSAEGFLDQRHQYSCCSQRRLETETAGLYLTQKGIMQDCGQDFLSFWNPLAAQLNIFAADWIHRLEQQMQSPDAPTPLA